LTPLFVEAAIERIALEEDPAYTQLWLSLTTVQKKALSAVIGTGGRLLLSKAVNDQYGLAVASMQKALRVLTDRGIVREEQTRGDVRQRLDDPFLATWLRIARTA
jgi:DNA-binding transcriptional regulator YhcF (GntR family)